MPSLIASPFNLSLFIISAALYFSAVSSNAAGSKVGGGSAVLEDESRKEGSKGGKRKGQYDICATFIGTSLSCLSKVKGT